MRHDLFKHKSNEEKIGGKTATKEKARWKSVVLKSLRGSTALWQVVSLTASLTSVLFFIQKIDFRTWIVTRQAVHFKGINALHTWLKLPGVPPRASCYWKHVIIPQTLPRPPAGKLMTTGQVPVCNQEGTTMTCDKRWEHRPAELYLSLLVFTKKDC